MGLGGATFGSGVGAGAVATVAAAALVADAVAGSIEGTLGAPTPLVVGVVVAAAAFVARGPTSGVPGEALPFDPRTAVAPTAIAIAIATPPPIHSHVNL